MRKDPAHKSSPPLILIAVFLIFSAGIIVAGYHTFQGQKRDFLQSVSERLSAIAESKVAELTQWRSERFADMKVLCENPVFIQTVQRQIDYGRTETHASLQEWLDLYQLRYGYEHVFLLDAQAAQQLASPRGAVLSCEKVTHAAADIFRSGAPVLIDLHSHMPARHIHLAVAGPVYDQGRPLALVIFDIDAGQYLCPLLKRWPTPSSTAETLLVRRDGDTVLFLNELRFNKEAALRLHVPLTQTETPAVRAALGQTGVFEGVDYRGRPVIADVRGIPRLPWKMVNRMDIEEVYAPLRARLRAAFMQVAFLVLILGLGLALFWRQQRLSETRRRMRRQQLFAASIRGLLGSVSQQGASRAHSIGDITEIAARSMAVRRASIWRYSEDYSRIVCLDLYDAILEEHSSEQVLNASDFAQYTASHKTGQVIAAEDVLQDPRTRDIPLHYFNEAGIKSLLDAPVWRGGRLVALLSFEQVGEKRRWDPEEEQFAQTLAAYVANHLESEERARAEVSLRNSEERFRAVVENVPAGIFIQTDHRFAYLNEYAATMFGVDSASRLIGQPVLERFHPDYHAQVLKRIALLNEKQLPVEQAVEHCLRNDGSQFIAEVSAVPFLYNGSHGALVFFNDITGRKKNEEALGILARISTIFLTAADEDIYDQVLTVVLDVMKSPLGVFGYIDTDGALIVPTLTRQIDYQCYVPDKTIRFPMESWGDSSWPRALRQKKIMFSNEPSIQLPDGHVVISRHISLPVKLGGEVIGLLQVANKAGDYTDADVQQLQGIADHIAPILSARLARDRFEKKLHARNEELSHFSYAVSHDLRSPLVTIKTFMGYLEKDMEARDSCRICKDIAFMRGATDKMTRMLDELLVFTRIGRLDNPVVIVPLQSVVKDAMTAVAGRMAERGVKVKVTLEPLLLRGDRPRLVDMFQNLLDNAVKFMGDQPNPFIEIGFENVQGVPEVFVRDNGMGIDPRYQARVFNLFEKIDPSYEGTGMGLALVKRIVAEHGGSIRVESDGIGKGACFRFTLQGKRETKAFN